MNHPASPTLHAALLTPPTAGAIAIIQLAGPRATHALAQLTGQRDWPAGRLRLTRFADIDDGLAVRLRDELVQLMPHGGPRIVARLLDHLATMGVCIVEQLDPEATYPEADSPLEADALATLSRAASPAAVDLLLAQPALWRRQPPPAPGSDAARAILERSDVLDRLVAPPTVVVVGRANVGKSTLTNRLLGRNVSLVADLPGTTRDWVGASVELLPQLRGGDVDAAARVAGAVVGVAVRWLDTPGLHRAAGRVESAAIDAARRVIADAHVLIAMRDAELDWPEADDLPRAPDLYVVNKVDTPPGNAPPPGQPPDGRTPATALPISAQRGHNVALLEDRVVTSLGLDALSPPPRWAFSPTLRAVLRGEADIAWPRYAGL